MEYPSGSEFAEGVPTIPLEISPLFPDIGSQRKDAIIRQEKNGLAASVVGAFARLLNSARGRKIYSEDADQSKES